MEKFGTFLFGAVGYVVGALFMVGGWWLSMLNISIDRYSGTDFVNTWTILGLILIFIGAYIPVGILKYRGHTVRKRQKLRDAATDAQAQVAALAQIQPTAAADHPPAAGDSGGQGHPGQVPPTAS
jgi:hypothetical protein